MGAFVYFAHFDSDHVADKMRSTYTSTGSYTDTAGSNFTNESTARMGHVFGEGPRVKQVIGDEASFSWLTPK